MPFAAAFKPNAAFFEPELDDAYALAKAAASCDEHPITILDAKRGDIGNTSGAYARSVFVHGGFDALTVNPMMGHDCVGPFLTDPSRGAFLLCLTSNPGADDFLLKHDLYKRIAEKAVEWNVNDNVGLVVGATRPEYAASVREIAPDLPLLIPGVGSQGGSLEETLDAIGAKYNRRFVINASRAIMFAAAQAGEGKLAAVARAACELRDQINVLL